MEKLVAMYHHVTVPFCPGVRIFRMHGCGMHVVMHRCTECSDAHGPLTRSSRRDEEMSCAAARPNHTGLPAQVKLSPCKFNLVSSFRKLEQAVAFIRPTFHSWPRLHSQMFRSAFLDPLGDSSGPRRSERGPRHLEMPIPNANAMAFCLFFTRTGLSRPKGNDEVEVDGLGIQDVTHVPMMYDV